MSISIYFRQLVLMTNFLLEAPNFIFKNKLWKGFFKDRLIIALGILTLILFAKFGLDFINSKVAVSEINLESGDDTLKDKVFNIENLYSGSHAFTIMILIQLLLVHFSNKTISVKLGQEIKMSFKELVWSQLRSLIVSIRNWVINLILGIGIVILLSIFGPDFLVKPIKYILLAYFVGYLFLDSYLNAFGVSIKKSAPIIRQHIGAALILGLVTKVLFLLPVIGPLIASFICSVAATRYMLATEDSHVGQLAFPD